jgi:hypothetical protein
MNSLKKLIIILPFQREMITHNTPSCPTACQRGLRRLPSQSELASRLQSGSDGAETCGPSVWRATPTTTLPRKYYHPLSELLKDPRLLQLRARAACRGHQKSYTKASSGSNTSPSRASYLKALFEGGLSNPIPIPNPKY